MQGAKVYSNFPHTILVVARLLDVGMDYVYTSEEMITTSAIFHESEFVFLKFVQYNRILHKFESLGLIYSTCRNLVNDFHEHLCHFFATKRQFFNL